MIFADTGIHDCTCARPTLQHWPEAWRLGRPLLALRSGTDGLSPAELGLYSSLETWYGGIGRVEKALAYVGVGPGGECVQVEDGDTPAVDGQCDRQHPDDIEQESSTGLG